MTFLILKCLCDSCGFDTITIIKDERDDGGWCNSKWFTCPNCETILTPTEAREEVPAADWNQFKAMWRKQDG